MIPMTNPDVRFRGKLQTMKLPNGDTKGLKHFLEEQQFNISISTTTLMVTTHQQTPHKDNERGNSI